MTKSAIGQFGLAWQLLSQIEDCFTSVPSFFRTHKNSLQYFTRKVRGSLFVWYFLRKFFAQNLFYGHTQKNFCIFSAVLWHSSEQNKCPKTKKIQKIKKNLNIPNFRHKFYQIIEKNKDSCKSVNNTKNDSAERP